MQTQQTITRPADMQIIRLQAQCGELMELQLPKNLTRTELQGIKEWLRGIGKYAKHLEKARKIMRDALPDDIDLEFNSETCS